jgi:hypothetical protein
MARHPAGSAAGGGAAGIGPSANDGRSILGGVAGDALGQFAVWWRAIGHFSWNDGPMPTRRQSLGTATLLIVLTALAGCGSDSGDADDVPTITTQPSTPASTTPTAGSATPSTEASSTSATETTVPVTETATPTETETGPSPEPPSNEQVGPTTYREALERIGDSRPIAQPVPRFATEDDVIYCLLDDAVIGPSCELSRGFIEDAAVCGGGAAEGVGRIETYDGRARPVCPTDTIREPGAEVILGDGVVSNGGGARCLVDSVGVTCVDINAHTGFFLAPGEYHVF